MDYINGRIIDKYYARAGATIALVSSLVINLGLLAMFKYSGFFIENINTFLHTSISNPNFKLPIGISFYTFQTLSYTIDMYINIKLENTKRTILLFFSLQKRLYYITVV